MENLLKVTCFSRIVKLRNKVEIETMYVNNYFVFFFFLNNDTIKIRNH